MTVGEELIAMANDYLARRIDLPELDMWLAARVQELYEFDKTDQPGAGLSGFIQVRIYETHDGLPEDDLRSDLDAYLDQNRLRTGERERARG